MRTREWNRVKLCPECHGRGEYDDGKRCGACHGQGYTGLPDGIIPPMDRGHVLNVPPATLENRTPVHDDYDGGDLEAEDEPKLRDRRPNNRKPLAKKVPPTAGLLVFKADGTTETEQCAVTLEAYRQQQAAIVIGPPAATPEQPDHVTGDSDQALAAGRLNVTEPDHSETDAAEERREAEQAHLIEQATPEQKVAATAETVAERVCPRCHQRKPRTKRPGSLCATCQSGLSRRRCRARRTALRRTKEQVSA